MADIPESTNLLPCPNPWCASHDEGELPNDEDVWQFPALTPRYRVQCSYCSVNGPTADTEDKAITAWNAILAATPAPAVDAKARADMAAALRNTPAEALREAGYLERAAKMIEAPAVDAVELAAFGASEHACALYPGKDQAAERAAFIAGAAHEAKTAVDAVPAGEVLPVAQRAARIKNSTYGVWWNGLTDHQRRIASLDNAFHAGVTAALSHGEGR